MQEKLEQYKNSGWTLDHVGHAVNDIEQALRYYQDSLGFSLDARETLDAERVEVAFLKLANTLIELIAPLVGNELLTRFISRRGEGLHHVCYRVSSVNAELERLKKAGLRLIDQQSRAGSRGLAVAFIHPSSCMGVLTELCSEKP